MPRIRIQPVRPAAYFACVAALALFAAGVAAVYGNLSWSDRSAFGNWSLFFGFIGVVFLAAGRGVDIGWPAWRIAGTLVAALVAIVMVGMTGNGPGVLVAVFGGLVVLGLLPGTTEEAPGRPANATPGQPRFSPVRRISSLQYFSGLGLLAGVWPIAIVLGSFLLWDKASAVGWIGVWASLAVVVWLAIGRCLDAGWSGRKTAALLIAMGLGIFLFGRSNGAGVLFLVSGAALVFIGFLPRSRAGLFAG